MLTAISSKDNVELTKQINNLCYDLSPQPTTDDEIGHEENLNTLISRLETNCDIEAELVCNACIKTFPARSEIKVTATLLNGTYVKTIHIATPEENNLTYASIHD